MLPQEMTWREVGDLSRDTPVVFPVAARERHGRHMPLFTDSLLLEAVVRRSAAEKRGPLFRLFADDVVAPTDRVVAWYGRGRDG